MISRPRNDDSPLPNTSTGDGLHALSSLKPSEQEDWEKSLVADMLDGDRAAFDSFVEHYTPGLYRYSRAHLRDDPDSVPDLVQSTLAVAMERLESFRGQGPLGAWLVGICRFQIAAHRRRLATRRRFAAADVEDFDSLQADTPSSHTKLEKRRLDARVHSTLQLLSPPYGDVLQWKYLHDLSVKDIAARLDLSPKAAESILTRARRAFRKVFDQARSARGEAN